LEHRKKERTSLTFERKREEVKKESERKCDLDERRRRRGDFWLNLIKEHLCS